MIRRLRKKFRFHAVQLLDRAGLLERALDLRQRRNRRRWKAQENSVRRSLAATVHGLESERSEIIGSITGRPGQRRGNVGRVREQHRVVDAMVSNRALALAAIERVGVPHQQLPLDSPNRYRVAVPDSARSALLTALSEIDVTVHLFLDRSGLAKHEQVVRLDRAKLPQIERVASGATVWRVFEYLVLPDGTDAFGDLHGCEIEFWTDEEDGTTRSARWNQLATVMTPAEFGSATTVHPLISTPEFPIDLVYTWVDGDDPAWRKRRAAITGVDATPRHAEAASAARFASRDELLYSLRSVERYADFVRNVYIVTDQQQPDWLDTEADGLFVIDHTEIFDDHTALPTFNSHAIESRLHHIPGLSEHYLYLNDDFLFGRRVLPNLFFSSNGMAHHFLSRALIPFGEPSFDEKPVDAAAMNSRRLVEDLFRVTPTRKFKHAPYPQLRSVNAEIESLFSEEIEQTARSRFRHPSDLAVASSLHHHVAYVTKRSMPGRIEARYVDLGQANLEARLDRLLRARDFDSLCLNDSDLEFTDQNRKARLVADFLDAYLPAKSRYER